MGVDRISWLVVCLASFGGCDWLDPSSDGKSTGDTGAGPSDADADADADADSDADADTDSDADTDTDAGGWTFSAHPCVGNRTDALWADDQDTLWVGCGTTATGYGLFRSTDGGLGWTSPDTSPSGFFDAMRVDSVSRSSDGLLYVAGIHGAEQVVSVDTSVEPYVVSEVFTSTSQVWNTFQVGSFRRAPSGLAVAESLNGYGLAIRPGDAAPFEDAYGAAGSHQILDLVEYDGSFYGVGSTISEPPIVFLPPPGGHDPAESFALVPVELVSGVSAFDGELWGIAVDAGGIAVAGVNQDADVGYVFVSGADPTQASTWSALDVSSVVGDEPTWMRGICRSGATIVAVGEYSRRAEGLILRSDDGGGSFTDVTPSDEVAVPPLHECVVFDDGDLIVTGADGFVGSYAH
ncbi:MAG: hypothetical protein ABMB14_04905 [Myxococcota bacterium]